MLLTDKLTAIGDAVRVKTGTEDPMTLDEMATAIEGIASGGTLPEGALVIDDVDTSYMFSNDNWNWFIEAYGDQVTTSGLVNCQGMFDGCATLTEIPFDFNFDGTQASDIRYMFRTNTVITNSQLQSIGAIRGANISRMDEVFSGCVSLRYPPEFIDCDFTAFNTGTVSSNNKGGNIFSYCCSLRSIPQDLLGQLHNKVTSYSGSSHYNTFWNCYVLDKIQGIYPSTATLTKNVFSSTFVNCHRAREITFAVQEDGTPYTRTWSNQTIDLSQYVGYCYTYNKSHITGYNSGLTTDTEITDMASAQKYWYIDAKNGEYVDDGWTTDPAYSRYYYKSAVNTINSLPDCSSGSGNIIKFYGSQGSLADPYNTYGTLKSISELTEEDIAVATAKGWTVSLV